MAKKYFLTYSSKDIDKRVKQYLTETYPECSCNITESGTIKKIEKTKNNVKSLLNLTIINGQISHFVQGKEENKCICEECWQKIVETLPLVSEINTWLSIKDVAKDVEENFIRELGEIDGIGIEKTGNKDEKIDDVLNIKNNDGCSVRFTYYSNGTLMIQGRVSTLFVGIQNILLEKYVDSVSKVDEIFSNLHISGTRLYSDNIDELVDDTSQLKGSILETLLMSTIKLTNSKIGVGDYSCYIMGMCRAIEGLMAKKFSQEGHVFQPKETWAACFDCDTTSDTHYVNTSFAGIIARPDLKKALEDCYEFLKKRRNTSFHVDKSIVEATTIIASLDEAKEIIDDGLKVINKLCNNW